MPGAGPKCGPYRRGQLRPARETFTESKEYDSRKSPLNAEHIMQDDIVSPEDHDCLIFQIVPET